MPLIDHSDRDCEHTWVAVEQMQEKLDLGNTKTWERQMCSRCGDSRYVAIREYNDRLKRIRFLRGREVRDELEISTP